MKPFHVRSGALVKHSVTTGWTDTKHVALTEAKRLNFGTSQPMVHVSPVVQLLALLGSAHGFLSQQLCPKAGSFIFR